MKQKSKPRSSFLQGRIRLYHLISFSVDNYFICIFSGCSPNGKKNRLYNRYHRCNTSSNAAIISTGNSGPFSANCYQLTIGPTTLSAWANDNGSYSKITFDPYVSTPSMQLDINSYLDCRLLLKPNASDMPGLCTE